MMMMMVPARTIFNIAKKLFEQMSWCEHKIQNFQFIVYFTVKCIIKKNSSCFYHLQQINMSIQIKEFHVTVFFRNRK